MNALWACTRCISSSSSSSSSSPSCWTHVTAMGLGLEQAHQTLCSQNRTNTVDKARIPGTAKKSVGIAQNLPGAVVLVRAAAAARRTTITSAAVPTAAA
eukprot:CAMPEP_0182531080 /NCGR_PEP_ID=MMETSP1323-20130603/7768_1 /TAXON_ID=236787 /ORGANISM="Florenciella parvula, Strain RCC1693" /LENGTH=98 /DNA_ID=CAMNT_0024740545 /DNA_START=380 /DNA_END=673 /DNA_ORIENTATION=-